MSYGGVGSPGGGFGGEADTGGPAGGSSGGSSGGGSGGSSNLGDNLGTVGSGDGYGSGHSQGLGVDGGVSSDAISAAESVADSFDSAASAAESTFGGWQDEVGVDLGPQNVAYGPSSRQAATIATTPQISRDALTSALEIGDLRGLHNQAARPSTMATLGSGLLSAANPALGLGARGYQAHSAARDAQGMTQATNDAFGTSLDHGYGNAMGAQARGAVAGAIGGRVGANLGARGAMAIGGRNIESAMTGAVVGGTLAGRQAAHLGKGTPTGSATAQSTPGSGNERDAADLTNAQDIARARQEAQRNQQLDQQLQAGRFNAGQMYGYEPRKAQFDSLADATTRIFG